MGNEWDGFATAVTVILLGFPVGALLAVVTVLVGLCRCHGPFWITAVLSCLVNGGFIVYLHRLILGPGVPWFIRAPLLSLLATLLAMGFYAVYAASRAAPPDQAGNDPPTPE